MRVTVLLEQLRAPVPGGTGRYSRDLAEALLLTAEPADAVQGWATRGPRLGLDLPVATSRVPRRLLPRLWERGVGPRPHAVDVVHAPTLLVPPTARGSRPALVVTVHDVVPWTHPETLTPRGVDFHRRMGERAAREADLVLTPTQAVADALGGVLDLRCPVVAVPPGVSRHVTRPLGSTVEAGSAAPYVLFVGTLEPRKGLDVLADAMADPRLQGVDLVCVGPTGWGEVSTEDLALRSGLGARLRAVGFVPDTALSDLYAGAAVLAMPSRAEGFGLPVLEAMAAGTPVVISDDPALVEVAGGAAAVAPVGDVAGLADALSTVVSDEARRGTMRDAGLTRARAFSWEASGRRLWQLYKELVPGA